MPIDHFGVRSIKVFTELKMKWKEDEKFEFENQQQ